MNRPTVDESQSLEILPWGRTKEDQDKLDAKKAAGRRGWHGCLLMIVAGFAFVVYTAGYLAGATFR